jgi:hypothetical protein
MEIAPLTPFSSFVVHSSPNTCPHRCRERVFPKKLLPTYQAGRCQNPMNTAFSCYVMPYIQTATFRRKCLVSILVVEAELNMDATYVSYAARSRHFCCLDYAVDAFSRFRIVQFLFSAFSKTERAHRVTDATVSSPILQGCLISYVNLRCTSIWSYHFSNLRVSGVSLSYVSHCNISTLCCI